MGRGKSAIILGVSLVLLLFFVHFVLAAPCPGSPSAEICDNIDNDCDGAIDENVFYGNTEILCGNGSQSVFYKHSTSGTLANGAAAYFESCGVHNVPPYRLRMDNNYGDYAVPSSVAPPDRVSVLNYAGGPTTVYDITNDYRFRFDLFYPRTGCMYDSRDASGVPQGDLAAQGYTLISTQDLLYLSRTTNYAFYLYNKTSSTGTGLQYALRFGPDRAQCTEFYDDFSDGMKSTLRLGTPSFTGYAGSSRVLNGWLDVELKASEHDVSGTPPGTPLRSWYFGQTLGQLSPTQEHHEIDFGYSLLSFNGSASSEIGLWMAGQPITTWTDNQYSVLYERTSPTTSYFQILECGPDAVYNALPHNNPSGELLATNFTFHAKFEEGAATSYADSSHGGLAGTCSGGDCPVNFTQVPPGGSINNAINLNGDRDNIQFPDSPKLNPTDSFTVSFWIKRTTANTDNTYRTVLFKGYPDQSSGGFTNRQFMISTRARKIHVAWVTNDRVGIDQSTLMTGDVLPSSVNAGWQHVAVIFDKPTHEVRVYINGTLVHTQPDATLASGVRTSPTPFIIGRPNWPRSDRAYKGGLDDVRIYSKELTNAEIQALANRGNVDPDDVYAASYPPVEVLSEQIGTNARAASNVLRLSFNEPAGSTTVSDSSGGLNSGTCPDAQHCPVFGGEGALPSLGTSAFFDGTGAYDGPDADYVSAPQSPGSARPYNFNNGLTVALWIKPELRNQWNNIISKIDQSTLQGHNREFLFNAFNNRLGFEFATVGMTGEERFVLANETILLNDQWQHIAATIDVQNGIAYLYHNGRIIDAIHDARIVNGLRQTASSIEVGRMRRALSGATEFPYRGSIDEVRVYNRPLSAAEINELYDGHDLIMDNPTAVTNACYIYRTENIPYKPFGVFRVVHDGGATTFQYKQSDSWEALIAQPFIAHHKIIYDGVSQRNTVDLLARAQHGNGFVFTGNDSVHYRIDNLRIIGSDQATCEKGINPGGLALGGNGWREQSKELITGTVARLCTYTKTDPIFGNQYTIDVADTCAPLAGWTLVNPAPDPLDTNNGMICVLNKDALLSRSTTMPAVTQGQSCFVRDNLVCDPRSHTWKSAPFFHTNSSGTFPYTAQESSVYSVAPNGNAGCCPQNYCFNPNDASCVSSSTVASPSSLLSLAGNYYRCNAGTWQQTTPKTTPLRDAIGICSTGSQCFWSWSGTPSDSSRNCVNDGEQIGAYYCAGGNWTTTGKVTGQELLRMYNNDILNSQKAAHSDVALFCGRFDEVLNYVSQEGGDNSVYNKMLGLGATGGFACDQTVTPDVREDCVYSVCALRYNYPQASGGSNPVFRHNLLLGFTLTKNGTSYVPNLQQTFGITCPTGAGTVQCLESPNNPDVPGRWFFNNDLGILIYEPQSLFSAGSLFSNLFELFILAPLRNAFLLLIGQDPATAGDLSFLTGDSLYDSFYYAEFGRNGASTLTATRDARYTAAENVGGIFQQTVVLSYHMGPNSGVNATAFCRLMNQTSVRLARVDAYSCIVQSNTDAIAVSTDAQAIDAWRDVTARLRMCAYGSSTSECR